ncbi:DUF930 domain-containing protein [Nodosilinea sp. P-1105]|uniref:DUF930 domain-containing protein n=1 Tax=Nodosilinea sp. P-1105 TaxID=2546229 RepID=UPI00146BBB1F|nr:DUF930 domain-containing protein [Nodosilinea sp. P-1105]
MSPVKAMTKAAAIAAVTAASLLPWSTAQAEPVAHDNPSLQACQASLKPRVQREYANVDQVQWLTDTATESFVSNAETRYQGRGQFRQTDGWHTFSYNCVFNNRTGSISSLTYSIIN